MSERLYRKAFESEVESYPAGHKTTVPIYKPVEPVGTLTVRSNGTSHIDNLFDVLPGKYLLIPKGVDDE